LPFTTTPPRLSFRTGTACDEADALRVHLVEDAALGRSEGAAPMMAIFSMEGFMGCTKLCIIPADVTLARLEFPSAICVSDRADACCAAVAKTRAGRSASQRAVNENASKPCL
jgi:hypothetical protein